MTKTTINLLLCLLLGLWCSMAHAQQISIVSGTVKDEAGKPVSSATVSVKGKSLNSVTDDNGKFALKNVPSGATLVFSSIGYVSVEIKASSAEINATLKTSSSSLNDVVVTTALGIKRNTRSLGYSQEQIKGSEIAESNAPNVINALSGKMAGVNITSPNGVDGGSTRIIIGGNNTITGDNQPLIIIDGMPMDNTIPNAAQDVTAPKDWGSAINLINPQDIEDMIVLKGPAAAA